MYFHEVLDNLCNTIVVMTPGPNGILWLVTALNVILSWYNTKCDTVVVTLPNKVQCGLGSLPATMVLWVVCLSIPSVPTLCLKDPQMGDDTIHLEFLLTVRLFHWSKLPGCPQLKDKKNSFSK